MTKAIKIRIAKLDDHRKMVFWCAIGILFILCSTYAYFIKTSIFGAMDRTNIEMKLTDLESSVSDLESRFIAEQKRITIEYAYSNGFGNSPAIYVSRKPLGSVVSLGGGI